MPGIHLGSLSWDVLNLLKYLESGEVIDSWLNTTHAYYLKVTGAYKKTCVSIFAFIISHQATRSFWNDMLISLQQDGY